MQKWFLLYVTQNLPEASIIKGMLEENSVPVMIVNKQDSSYLNFGDMEIYVANTFKNIARQLVNKALMN